MGLSLGPKGSKARSTARRHRKSPDSVELQEQVRWLQRLTGDAGRDIHRASVGLRPTDWTISSAAGVWALVADWSERYDAQVDVTVLGLRILGSRSRPKRSSIGSFTNVLNNTRARHVSVVFERRVEEVRSVVEDGGIGFDVDSVNGAWVSMRAVSPASRDVKDDQAFGRRSGSTI